MYQPSTAPSEFEALHGAVGGGVLCFSLDHHGARNQTVGWYCRYVHVLVIEGTRYDDNNEQSSRANSSG